MRSCAATCASARRCDAAVREDPVARFSYPRWWIERVAAEYPDDWRASCSTPATSGRRCRCGSTARVGTREALLARFAAADVAATPAASLRHHRRPAAPGAGAAGLRRRRVLGAGPRRAARGAAARGRSRAARARRLRGARRQDHAPARTRRRRARGARQRRGAAAARRSENLARLRLAGARVHGARRRRRRSPPTGGTDGPSTASSPTSPAPRRAWFAAIRTASGCAARADLAGFCAPSRRIARRALAAARARRTAAVRDLLAVRRRERGTGRRRSSPATRRRCAKPSTSPRRSPHRGGQLLPSLAGRGPQSGRIFLRAVSQGLTRARRPAAVAVRADARTPVRGSRRTAQAPIGQAALSVHAMPPPRPVAAPVDRRRRRVRRRCAAAAALLALVARACC